MGRVPTLQRRCARMEQLEIDLTKDQIGEFQDDIQTDCIVFRFLVKGQFGSFVSRGRTVLI